MPQHHSVGQRVAEAIGGVLRKVGILRPQQKEQPTQVKARTMALNAGPMEIQGVPEMLAQEFADDLKQLIESQAFAWVPLSSGYAKRKQMLGQDPRILIATGRYVNALTPVQTPEGDWVVGIPATPLSAGSRYTLQDLARWLEFGTQNMPARPHWRPAMTIWKTKAYQAKLGMKHGVKTYLRRRGFK